MTWISIISIAMTVLGAIYVRQIVLFMMGLARLKRGTNTAMHSVVVLVAARNEEQNIEKCIAALDDQNYPRDKFTIIVIDDHSTDRTPEIVEQCADRFSKVKLLRARDRQANVSPKINALDYAIAHTSSELIFTTDADCIVGPNWISSMVRYFEETVGVVSGITLFSGTSGAPPLVVSFQSLDFFSQTACGAGAIGMNAVNNCNGSNMGFRRSVFTQVGGYTAISHVNSGSDSLLAQRILSMTHWKMKFAFEPDTHVLTSPLPSWHQVLEQRMRWAGQTPNYPPSTLVFLIASFMLYASLFLFIPLSILYWPIFPLPLLILMIKLAVDFRIVSLFARLSGVQGMMRFFFPSELLHIPVVLIAVCGSFLGTFEWKGRTLRREMSLQK